MGNYSEYSRTFLKEFYGPNPQYLNKNGMLDPTWNDDYFNIPQPEILTQFCCDIPDKKNIP
jgi:hypothetical protein